MHGLMEEEGAKKAVVAKVNELVERVAMNRGNKDDRDATIALVDEIAILCKDLSPMIVVFFAPPFYPAVSSRNHPLIRGRLRQRTSRLELGKAELLWGNFRLELCRATVSCRPNESVS